jgi:hypothetical protein
MTNKTFRSAATTAKTIVADCKYGTIENYIACQERKLRTHMADLLASSPGSGRRDGIYPESMSATNQKATPSCARPAN